MLKKLSLAIGATMISTMAFAGKIAIVDMQHIFHASARMKSINADLSKKFASERTSIVKMGEGLKMDMDKYNKNKSVMSKKSLTSLQTKITGEEKRLRAKQSAFQKTVYEAQNKAMSEFIDKVKATVKTEAKSQKVDLVLPKNVVLYSNNQTVDLTDAVLKSLD